DWGGNVELSVAKGTDLETGTISQNSRTAIEAAIEAGTMRWDDVTTAVRHTLTAMGQIGYLGLVTVNSDGTAAADPTPPAAIELPLTTGAEKLALLTRNDEIALESAVKGAVLLKNDDGALPVNGNDTIAVIGLTGQYTLTGHYAESSFGWLPSMKSPYESLREILPTAQITPAVGLDIVGVKIPDASLYRTEDGAERGVTLDAGGHVSTLPNVELLTGTTDYKNGPGGNALVFDGEAAAPATLTTYLEAPGTGTYELKMLGIGGQVKATIAVAGEEKAIPFGGGGALGNVQASDSRWATSSLIPTPEGMDVATSTVSVDLVQGQRYRIDVEAEPTSASKDLQLRLTWFAPGQRAADQAAAVQAAGTHKKVVVFVSDLGVGPAGEVTADPTDPDYWPQYIAAMFKSFQRETLALAADQRALLEDVIAAAKAAGNQVIVVLNIGLPVTMDWIDGADAVLNMWLPGQRGGLATAQLLTGAANPSGKLPVTFPRGDDDTQFGPVENALNAATVNTMTEGIFCGYRWYDAVGITPLFDFGHGLSYTNFSYSGLSVTKTAGVDYGFDVTFTVRNTGAVKGSEVAQVYLGEVPVPAGIQMAERQLAGFVRLEDLVPGEARTVTVKIDQAALSYWDPSAALVTRADGTKDKRVVALGARTVEVGAASDDIRLARQVTVDEPGTGGGSGGVGAQPPVAGPGVALPDDDGLGLKFSDAAS
ncbi:MAG: glycoside hydrolase family 3 C-terminal domain-containing protein, partial [Oscillospiraceae bacterium]|nr:glycoside hydrolase family 3 C-terminal domain-containing protein [Oscillospiraceae bacterium]